ncbi:MAG: hypothetical protein ABR517_04765 [Thermoanaerobaculia bacterium]
MSVDELVTAVAHLHQSIESMTDAFYQQQLRLAATVLTNSVEAIRNDPSPAALSDAEFAFGDVTAITSEVPQEDEDLLNPPIEQLRRALTSLKEGRTLDPELVAKARELQQKLRDRRTALERHGFRFEGEEQDHIPNHPRELCLPARQLHRALQEQGFVMRPLEKLVSNPDEFVYHDVADLIAELDIVIR